MKLAPWVVQINVASETPQLSPKTLFVKEFYLKKKGIKDTLSVSKVHNTRGAMTSTALEFKSQSLLESYYEQLPRQVHSTGLMQELGYADS